MSSPSFDADSTLGALLVGTLVSYVLFGVTTTQVYIYYDRFPEDSSKMKAMVASVWLGELAHVICIGHSLYVMVITDYGHPERLAHIPSSLFAATFVGGMVSAGVQSFFAFRIYILSKSLWIPCICWAMSLFRVLPSNIVTFSYGIHEPLGEFIDKWNWLFDTVWAISAANDLLIAISLVFLLYRQRNYTLKRTTAVVNKLIAWTVETGVVTSAAGIIMMAFFIINRASFIWMAWFVVIARLFSNSLLASLNSRASLRALQETVVLASTPPVSATLERPMDCEQSIEMNKMSITTYNP
ncbi:hypothetical protein B0H15DRAFT_851016 [Mycena belliarum]|uniref:DUF6534 domain-containing protein n=1 Tax=Mycena belliarum TaxID=1033014 RepID=A0AAD6XN93_9AGAR|nr:hypothetical protein B0H15DRAFT_851016 [Mycena belliae]